MPVPKYDDLFNPLLQALHELGSSASIAELEDRVATNLDLTEQDISEIHRGTRTKLSYNMALARTYLKKYGLLNNSSRGIWILTPLGQKTESVDKEEVKRFVVVLDRENSGFEETETTEELEELTWKDKALEAVQSMTPEAFERLCQRILRESGFETVEVTGKSGDGGIDGHGIVKLGKVLSFHVHFQCKRYKSTVSPSAIRDFRGAMVGRADKGIIITTGTFSNEARLEASRDGAPPLDLINGDELVQMLKEYQLGITVKEKIVEEISVDKEWFIDY